VLFAVMTLLSGSIWPAVIAHVTLNLVPMALLPASG
jgi:membrane protease YdiL (CAAX protease family)